MDSIESDFPPIMRRFRERNVDQTLTRVRVGTPPTREATVRVLSHLPRLTSTRPVLSTPKANCVGFGFSKTRSFSSVLSLFPDSAAHVVDRNHRTNHSSHGGRCGSRFTETDIPSRKCVCLSDPYDLDLDSGELILRFQRKSVQLPKTKSDRVSPATESALSVTKYEFFTAETRSDFLCLDIFLMI